MKRLQLREQARPDGLQRRYAEFRFDESKRTITGTALRYGDIAELPWGEKERFERGAFGNLSNADIILNVQHQRARPIARTGGGGLAITDGAAELRLSAVLPETRDGDDVLQLVRTGVLRGLSIEFYPETTRLEDGVTVITKAELKNVAIVDRPAYPASIINARGAAESTEEAIRARGDLLATIIPLLPEGTEWRGKSSHELLVLAVGDTVTAAASRSEDYLLAKAEALAERRTDKSRMVPPPPHREYAAPSSFNIVGMIERRNAAAK